MCKSNSRLVLLATVMQFLLVFFVSASAEAQSRGERWKQWPDRWEGKRDTNRFCSHHEGSCPRPEPTWRNEREKRDKREFRLRYRPRNYW
jgi:hypothetical protein